MEIVVQKFGGTSLNTAGKRLKAAERIVNTLDEGFFPVVVVSAIGRKGDPYATDTLIDFATSANNAIEFREKDLLMSCGEIISAVIMVQILKNKNLRAEALTGAQAGIVTDNQFGDSNIKKVNSYKVKKLVENNIIPVIAGFQGITEDGEITTLGRGGSDTTAAVIGSAINASYIEIYTDVEGVMTADPDKVEQAEIIKRVSYNEACELAYQGARVIHPRAAEIAMQEGVPIKVKSTENNKAGTVIAQNIESDRPVTGVTSRNDIIFIKIISDEAQNYATDLNIFSVLASHKISVDFINIKPAVITFIVNENCRKKITEILENMKFKFQLSGNYTKVSVVGGGMTGRPGIMAEIITALQERKIQIYQTTDSHTTISCLLEKNVEKDALQALHNIFGLSKLNRQVVSDKI